MMATLGTQKVPFIALLIALGLSIAHTPRANAQSTNSGTISGIGTAPGTTTTTDVPETTLPPATTSTPTPAPRPPSDSATQKLPSHTLRTLSNLHAAVTLDTFGIPIPFKYGAALSWNLNDKWTVEGSYSTGNISFDLFGLFDLGSIDETLIAAHSRYFLSNSFNLIGGLSLQQYDARVGSDIVERLSAGNLPGDIDVISVETLGLQLGFGNRWQWNNGITLGVDWLVLNIPFATQKSDVPILKYVTDEGDRDTVEKALSFLRYVPTGAAAKVALGYSF